MTCLHAMHGVLQDILVFTSLTVASYLFIKVLQSHSMFSFTQDTKQAWRSKGHRQHLKKKQNSNLGWIPWTNLPLEKEPIPPGLSDTKSRWGSTYSDRTLTNSSRPSEGAASLPWWPFTPRMTSAKTKSSNWRRRSSRWMKILMQSWASYWALRECFLFLMTFHPQNDLSEDEV